jgi:hypothetical protein
MFYFRTLCTSQSHRNSAKIFLKFSQNLSEIQPKSLCFLCLYRFSIKSPSTFISTYFFKFFSSILLLSNFSPQNFFALFQCGIILQKTGWFYFSIFGKSHRAALRCNELSCIVLCTVRCTVPTLLYYTDDMHKRGLHYCELNNS